MESQHYSFGVKMWRGKSEFVLSLCLCNYLTIAESHQYLQIVNSAKKQWTQVQYFQPEFTLYLHSQYQH